MSLEFFFVSLFLIFNVVLFLIIVKIVVDIPPACCAIGIHNIHLFLSFGVNTNF